MRAQLLGQRRELAVPAERVAGEVGELQQQVAGPLGVGAHEGRDGGQRVVDEVRADLRPQGAHLGLDQPGARRVQLGQLELGRRPSGRPRWWRAPDRRRSSGRTPPGVPTTRSSTVSGATTATRIGQSGSGQATPAGPTTWVRPSVRAPCACATAAARVVVAGAVPGEQRLAVGEGHRGRAEQGAQVADRLAGSGRGEPGAQRRRGQAAPRAGWRTWPGRPACRRGAGSRPDRAAAAAIRATSASTTTTVTTTAAGLFTALTVAGRAPPPGGRPRVGAVTGVSCRARVPRRTRSPTSPRCPAWPRPSSEARAAVDGLRGHRVLRRSAEKVSSESALRGARASAALEGADVPLDGAAPHA